MGDAGVRKRRRGRPAAAAALALLAFVLAPGTAAPAPASADGAPQAELRRYLTAVGPAATKTTVERRRAEQAVRAYGETGNAGEAAALLRKAQRRSFAAAAAAARVRPPSELRGPHSAVGQAARRMASSAGRLAVQLEYGPASPAAIANFRSSSARALELERHFRTELTAQLRRAGVVVPLWLKKIAAR
jgi:hypothetical protein